MRRKRRKSFNFNKEEMYYSPILFSKISDLNLTPYHNPNYSLKDLNLKDKILIFSVHSMGWLNKLVHFLNGVNKPWILVTAMEDTQIPLEIDVFLMEKITKNKYFKHWFTINKTIPNNNYFTSIPYGLDYWTLTTKKYFGEGIQNFETQNSELTKIIKLSKHFSKRIPKIFCNFHFNITDERHGGYRRKLPNILPNILCFYQKYKLPRYECWQQMSNYSFVASPFGHGFDCIRTFEALCLGCIVIMKKSFLDIIYEDLPVLLVDEWEDINEKLLEDTLKLYQNKQFNFEKLKFSYWQSLVLSKF